MVDLLIDVGYFFDLCDLVIMIVGVCIVCQIVMIELLCCYCWCELFGGCEGMDDVVWEIMICQCVDIIYYFVGICCMGEDQMVVVDV